VTNSVPLCEAGQKIGKIRVLSVAGLLARGIRSIHEETSISELFYLARRASCLWKANANGFQDLLKRS